MKIEIKTITTEKIGNKQKATYSLDKDVLKEFNRVTKMLKINKSRFLEDCMNNFLEQIKNGDE